MKGFYKWKCKFYRLCIWNPASGLLKIGNKLEKWQCRHNFFDITSSSNFFDVVLFLFSSLATGLSFMSVPSLVLELWNSEIGNNPAWVLPNIWRLGQVRDTKFSTNISNKMLLNATKCQVYSFYYFWVIKGKPIEGGRG